jgi:hypothetical protein
MTTGDPSSGAPRQLVRRAQVGAAFPGRAYLSNIDRGAI